jgi:hypothetical protein
MKRYGWSTVTTTVIIKRCGWSTVTVTVRNIVTREEYSDWGVKVRLGEEYSQTGYE